MPRTPRLAMALLAALASVAAALPLSPALRLAPAARAAVPVLVVNGKGFGHGVGMAQDGAYWMGRAGAGTPQILGQFYPGTSIGKATGNVRVPVLTGSREATLIFPEGGEVRNAPGGDTEPGFPVAVPRGGQVRVRFDGSRYYVTRPGSTDGGSPPPTDAPPPSTTAPPATTTTTARLVPTTTSTTTPATTTPPGPASTAGAEDPADLSGASPAQAAGESSSGRPLWGVAAVNGTISLPARGRRYRGVMEVLAASGALRLVNSVDVEQYLKGMGEVRDPSWPPAALRAQAIAARTYALRAMAGGEICEDQRCQVYLGAQVEYAAMNQAVKDTAGQVVVHGGRLASTVYSANGGGHSASREEGFGATGGDFPYLRPAPYTTQNPLPWTVKVALSDVAARVGYAGSLTAVRIGRTGASGRATEMIVDGSAGPKAVTGIAFDAAIGLRSTLFTVGTELSDTAPPPPTDAFGIQGLPDQAAALAATAVPGAPSGESVPPLPSGPPPAARLTSARPAPASDGGSPWAAVLMLTLLALGGGALWRSPRRAAMARFVQATAISPARHQLARFRGARRRRLDRRIIDPDPD